MLHRLKNRSGQRLALPQRSTVSIDGKTHPVDSKLARKGSLISKAVFVGKCSRRGNCHRSCSTPAQAHRLRRKPASHKEKRAFEGMKHQTRIPE